MNISIDIASDFICPWCFIGKKRLKDALALVREKHPEIKVQINWLPFFLSIDTPPSGEVYQAFLEAKFGGPRQVAEIQARVASAAKDAGVELNLDRIAVRSNTMAAHRLVYRAQSLGHRPEEIEALADGVFAAYFQLGQDIGRIETLADIAAACGDRKEDVIAYLSNNEGEPQVRSLFRRVSELGVSGVPFFIFQRQLAVSGAQTGEVLAAAMLQAMQSKAE